MNLMTPVAQSAGLSVEPVIVTVGDCVQLSDAVGVTGAGIGAVQSISTLAGVFVNTGDCVSAVQVTVREVEEVLPQPSVAVHVLVCVLVQVPVASPVDEVSAGDCVQLSEAEAVPNAALI